MKPQERHNESREDYLEAILRITQRKGLCRSVDIADQLEISKPSVSVAMVNLREAGLIEMESDKRILLTEAGREIAERIYRRHVYFKKLLQSAGVEEGVAEHEACSLEHAVSEDSFKKIEAYLGER
ncbi:MAG: metal-dependent transcriptional regulator [Clostridia bacterium]|nr:metal-dependent transcriptional regulator [Clostridia bacterium]MBQ8973311.1 metal-dependent transcriptional regulator [Clostridia bacterium]